MTRLKSVAQGVQGAARDPTLAPDASGQRHRIFQRAIKYKDPDTGIVRLSTLGRTFVVLASPAAQHSLLKQTPWLPKSAAVSKVFALLVRCLRLT
jgi:hypothetical protein